MPRRSNRSKKSRSHRSHGVRLNPVRQLVYVLLALASLAVGYGVTVWLRDGRPPSVSQIISKPIAQIEKKETKPWFESQKSPPSLIQAPDAPIFPEPNGVTPGAPQPRAYEEALPVEIYEPEPTPPVVIAPSPPKAVEPARPAPAETESPPPQVAAVPPPAWRRHAVAVETDAGRPMVAIVIDDMGVDRKRSRRAIALPPPLTLAFLTYAEDLDRQTAAASASGHELMVHMAMEPRSDKVDPGPNVLRVENDADEIRRRLDWGLNRFGAYVGINNHMGSRFTADARGMAVVMDELRQRGLMFLDSRTSGSSVGARMAREAGVPVLERNVFLDNINDLKEVLRRLDETERLARRRGYAIAIGHPRDATIAALDAWMPEAAGRGIALVPVSAILHRLTAVAEKRE